MFVTVMINNNMESLHLSFCELWKTSQLEEVHGKTTGLL